MIYLGSLGRMIGIKCPASQNVQAEERHSFSTTLEGRRKAQVKPTGRRTWSLQTSDATTPSEHSLLSQFANGAWGHGPFVFVSADASVTNLLTPDAADCKPGEHLGAILSQGSPLWTPDGWAASSFMKSTAGRVYLGKDMTPIIQGQPVTASAYVRGEGAGVSIHWYDSTGAVVTSSFSSVLAGATNVVRSWVTQMPPATAVSCRASVGPACVQVARPAITWSDKMLPYGDGQGCMKAVVSAMSRDQVLAVQGNTYSNIGFTVMEVG